MACMGECAPADSTRVGGVGLPDLPPRRATLAAVPNTTLPFKQHIQRACKPAQRQARSPELLRAPCRFQPSLAAWTSPALRLSSTSAPWPSSGSGSSRAAAPRRRRRTRRAPCLPATSLDYGEGAWRRGPGWQRPAKSGWPPRSSSPTVSPARLASPASSAWPQQAPGPHAALFAPAYSWHWPTVLRVPRRCKNPCRFAAACPLQAAEPCSLHLPRAAGA